MIEEQASDVVTAVFQTALSTDHALAMFASHRAWPEPLQGIASDMLVARMMRDNEEGACTARHSAAGRMVAHFLCASDDRVSCRPPPMNERELNERESQFRDFMDGRFLPWLLVDTLTKARMESNWARACDLEDDLDDSAVPETMNMASIWLAEALAADLQTSGIGLVPQERTSSPPVQ